MHSHRLLWNSWGGAQVTLLELRNQVYVSPAFKTLNVFIFSHTFNSSVCPQPDFFFISRQRINLQSTTAMAGKIVLHYFNGRGKMESIRWLLTVAEADVSEEVGSCPCLQELQTS